LGFFGFSHFGETNMQSPTEKFTPVSEVAEEVAATNFWMLRKISQPEPRQSAVALKNLECCSHNPAFGRFPIAPREKRGLERVSHHGSS
jgi:hypothetical protein